MSKNRWLVWTADMDATLTRGWIDPARDKRHVAAEIGVSLRSAERRASILELKRPGYRSTKRHSAILSLWPALSIGQIAIKVGVSRPTVWGTIRDARAAGADVPRISEVVGPLPPIRETARRRYARGVA